MPMKSSMSDEARSIVTDWLGMFGAPQIDFQQSELLQQAIAAAIAGRVAGESATPTYSAGTEISCAKFVMWALMDGPWQGADIDGGAAQDKATELGLIKKTVYDPVKHGDSDCCEPGDDWFVPAEGVVALVRGDTDAAAPPDWKQDQAETSRLPKVTSPHRAPPIDHSAEECPNFPGCHCVNDCIDGWKHPSPEDSAATRPEQGVSE